MPDAFFANNKTRKRKRSAAEGPSTSKKHVRIQSKQQPGSAKGKKTATKPARSRDEELSDATPDDDGGSGVDDMDLRAPDVDPNAYESAEEDEDETPAEKRLRLAKVYLDSVKQGLGLGKF
jgi:ribosomal RNA-processing protein 9